MALFAAPLKVRCVVPCSHAVRIMEMALQKYGNYERFEQATGGNLLTKSRIWYSVKKYMEKEGCMGEVRERHHSCM